MFVQRGGALKHTSPKVRRAGLLRRAQVENENVETHVAPEPGREIEARIPRILPQRSIDGPADQETIQHQGADDCNRQDACDCDRSPEWLRHHLTSPVCRWGWSLRTAP